MTVLNDFRMKIGKAELVPIIQGGMGVFFSAPELALEVCRLGGMGTISDAEVPFVSDKNFGTSFSKAKQERFKQFSEGSDKSLVKFNPEDVYQAQINHVGRTMSRKVGSGLIAVNIMEKLTMGEPFETLRVRLHGALDAGVDCITLAAGLHQHSVKLMEDNPRFRDVKIGIIVSSSRALKIFLRSASRSDRLPDYVIVEGPLAGGHLGFGEDWAKYDLKTIVTEIVQMLASENLNIPVVAAGGVFTGTDAVDFVKAGAAGVQVATRFTVTKECGVSESVKQKYFESREEDVVVNCASPTGYLMRMLKNSPCLGSNQKPCCEPLGYLLSKEGKCSYLEAWHSAPVGIDGKKSPIKEKVCLCYHFSKNNCYTCGHNVYRLRDTSIKRPDGSFQLLTAAHVFKDYLLSSDHRIALPEPEAAPAGVGVSAVAERVP